MSERPDLSGLITGKVIAVVIAVGLAGLGVMVAVVWLLDVDLAPRPKAIPKPEACAKAADYRVDDAEREAWMTLCVEALPDSAAQCLGRNERVSMCFQGVDRELSERATRLFTRVHR